MAGYTKGPDKKTVVAIIIIAVLLIAAIVGTVVFLKNRGTTEATDLASYNEQATGTTQDEQETTDTQEQSGEPATQSTEEQATEGTGVTEETATADAVDTENTDTTTAGNNQGTAGTTGSSTGTTGTTTQTTTGGTTSGTATGETTTENIQETVITEYETNIIPERLVAEGEHKTWEETGLNAPIVDTFRNMVILVPDVEITKTATAINGKVVTINEETGKVNETVKKDDVITYTITVENTGNVILNNIEVKDDLKVDYKEGETETTVEPGNVITTIETLLPGETATIEVNYTVTQDDVDNKTEIRNVATVTGTTPSGETETDDDDDTTVPTDKTAGIEVTKTATAIGGVPVTINEETGKANETVEKDDVITYTITVKNTGKVTLSDVAVTDDLKVNYKEGETETTVEPGNVITTIETLLPGETATIEVNYTVTQDDVDNKTEIRNVATVTGTTPSGETETDDDDDTTVPTDKTAGIEVTKTATAIGGVPVTINEETGKANETVEKDDVITYTITVENTGKVTLSDVAVTDDLKVNYKEGETETTVEPGNVITTIETLLPGETATVEVKYTVTQDDVDKKDVIRNVGTATGTTPSGDPVSDNDDDTTVPTAEPEPEIDFTVIPTSTETSEIAVPQRAILVLDFSSSMKKDRIDDLKKAVDNFLDKFLANGVNEVKIIEYDYNILKDTPFANKDNRDILDISKDKTGNGTNIDYGLTRANQYITAENAATTSVILMSDGSPYAYYDDKKEKPQDGDLDKNTEEALESAGWIKAKHAKFIQ